MSEVSLDLPPGWEELEEAPPVVLAAAEPEGAHPAFRANLVLGVTNAELGGGLQAIVDAAVERQAAELSGFHLIDREDCELAGCGCIRTLAHHDVEGRAVVVQQWQLIGAGRRHELTTSCGALDYPELAAALAATAASLTIE